MKMGDMTNVPGVYRDGDFWNVRARLFRAGVTIERRKRIEGSKADAIECQAQLRREVEAEAERVAVEGTRTRPTLGDFAQQWLASLLERRRSMKQAFIDVRLLYLERFVLPRFGAMEPRRIKPSQLDEWKLWLLKQRQPARIGKRKNPRVGEPYAHHTLLSAWATMRALLGFACMRVNAQNPIAGLRFDIEGVEAAPKESLTRDELARVLKAAETESPDIRAMMTLGFATGMRFAELSALEWGDIDLERGTIKIQRSHVAGQVGPPKTEATRRLVYVPPEIVAALVAHRKWWMTDRQQSQQVGRSKVSPHALFPSRTGTYRFPAVLKVPLERCCKLAGVDKRLTAHCMRRTANNLIRQAAGDVVARAMVGHATTDMTFRYSAVDADERGRAHRAAFGAAFTPSKRP